MWFHSKGQIFLHIIVFSSPLLCGRNIGREVRLMLPNTHTKKYMTSIYALIFQKHSKMCVYIRHIKKLVEIDYSLGESMQQKKVGWEVIFSEQGFAPSEARKPRWEFNCKSSALEQFFHVVLRLNGLYLCSSSTTEKPV